MQEKGQKSSDFRLQKQPNSRAKAALSHRKSYSFIRAYVIFQLKSTKIPLYSDKHHTSPILFRLKITT